MSPEITHPFNRRKRAKRRIGDNVEWDGWVSLPEASSEFEQCSMRTCTRSGQVRHQV